MRKLLLIAIAVCALGAGTYAAKAAVGIDAQVTLLDINPNRLAYLEDIFGASVTTLYSTEANIRKALSEADLVIGSVLIPGGSTPKIFKETCELDFTMSVENVHNKVRGLSPYPGAWMTFRDGAPLKIFRTHVEKCQVKENAGEIVTDGKKMLKVACSDGYLWLDEVQAAGKRRMSAEEMMRGWH